MKPKNLLNLEPFIVDGKKLNSDQVIDQFSKKITQERLEKLKKSVKTRWASVIPVLENISDSGNINAVMRTTEALGFLHLHIIESTQTSFKKANRVTHGAHKWLLTKKFQSTQECVLSLKNNHFHIYVTDLNSEKTIDEMDFTQPSAIVLGNEHKGASEEIKKQADDTFHLPIQGFSQSFNISVAAALILQKIQIKKQMRPEKEDLLSRQNQKELLAHYLLICTNKKSNTKTEN